MKAELIRVLAISLTHSVPGTPANEKNPLLFSVCMGPLPADSHGGQVTDKSSQSNLSNLGRDGECCFSMPE